LGLFFALIATMLFGISNIFARKGLEDHDDIDSNKGVLINLVIVNLVNLPILFFYMITKSLPGYNWNSIIYFIAAGFLNTFIGRMLLFSSIELIGPSRAGSFKIVSPAIVILVGFFFLGEKLSISVWIGSMTILLGVYMVSRETKEMGGLLKTNHFRTQNTLQDNKAHYKKGILLGLLSGVAFGSGNIFRKLGINLFPSFIMGVSIGSFVALLCSSIFIAIKGEAKEGLVALKRYWIGPYFWSGLLTSLALFCFFQSLQLAPASIVNSIIASECLFTMLFSKIIIGHSEHLNMNTVVRSLVIVIGLIILFIS